MALLQAAYLKKITTPIKNKLKGRQPLHYYCDDITIKKPTDNPITPLAYREITQLFRSALTKSYKNESLAPYYYKANIRPLVCLVLAQQKTSLKALIAFNILD
ncbi:hypothetical protein ACJJIF_19370 [Microbulbifer sp. SSSA002]|uniref:hypothetical protein n=1 Tax=unclassified Microbulbifer TaxID=2619833 RepID=UPI00403A4458